MHVYGNGQRLRLACGRLVVAVLLATGLLVAPSATAGGDPASGNGETFSAAGASATAALLKVFYAGNGSWQLCSNGSCGKGDKDWGADSLTYALALREQTTHDPSLVPVLAALAAAAPTYPAPCEGTTCTGWSDVPMWDTIALAREYEATHDPAALAKAEAAFEFVQDSTVFSHGACAAIPFQHPFGARKHSKTLETDGNAIKGALPLYEDTRSIRYLDDARAQYADARRYFLDPRLPLYTTDVHDNGKTCIQISHRFYASVNGDMIWNGLQLYRDTGQRAYLQEALATARAVSVDLNDPGGIFTDLPAQNDVAEPLVEAMYDLSVEEHVAFARRWILTNAAAALGERTTNRVFGRFFDGPPPPASAVTAWQANGGIALEIAAAALAPNATAVVPTGWATSLYTPRAITAPPAQITFHGEAIALVGTLGQTCCSNRHVRLLIDGKQTFDEAGLWQDESNAAGSVPNTILFAWRWPRPGERTIDFDPGFYYPWQQVKGEASFLYIQGYYVIPGNGPP